MKKSLSIRKAFTLIEVLLAIFILEIGLLGIAGFYASSFKITKMARNETTAVNLANGLLDEELAIPYDNLTIGTGIQTKYSTDINDPFYDWEKRIDIFYVDADLIEQPAETNMKKIIVNIFWQEADNERSFQTASIKSRH